MAIGVGLQLLPEATRRAAAGLDPRPALLRALGVLAAVAAPALLIFALVPALLLRVAFGPRPDAGPDALPVLGVAMTLLAVAYLTVQYMVALGELKFVWVLGVVAVSSRSCSARGLHAAVVRDGGPGPAVRGGGGGAGAGAAPAGAAAEPRRVQLTSRASAASSRTTAATATQCAASRSSGTAVP